MLDNVNYFMYFLLRPSTIELECMNLNVILTKKNK